MDWVEKTMMSAFVVFVLGGITWIIYAVYEDSQAEKFELRKDQWVCTKSHTETITTMITIYVDKTPVMIPQVSMHDICDEWTRKK